MVQSSLIAFGTVICITLIQGCTGAAWNAFDLQYWRCVYKRSSSCPDRDITFYLYTNVNPNGKFIDIRSPTSLKYGGWDPAKKNVIIIHGFNGTESKTPMTFIRQAYIRRGDYNVFTVDWEPLTRFPCYLSALSNTRLVAQCTAQLYSHITAHGALATKIQCVGHSLGAHICGMMSNHLTHKVHKIIGLDPARPLVDRYGTNVFKLTQDDAHVVQVIHTNAGALGEESQVGHIDFCVNGGRNQPGCKGHKLRRARCSHFQSACYFTATISGRRQFLGYPCTSTCPKRGHTLGLLPGRPVPMGEGTPDNATGTYCVQINHDNDCPFD